MRQEASPNEKAFYETNRNPQTETRLFIQKLFHRSFIIILMSRNFFQISIKDIFNPHPSYSEQKNYPFFKIKSLEDDEHIILIRQDDNSLKIIFTTPGTATGHSITIYGDDVPIHLKTFGLTTRQKLAKAIIQNQTEIRTKNEQISLKFMHSRQWQHLGLPDPVNLEVEELVEIVQFYYQLSKRPQRPSIAHSRSSRLLPIEE